MADNSTSGWFNLLDLDEDKSIVAPTTTQGSRYSTNSQGLMSSDVRKMQATKADSAPTDILTTIVNKIINGFSGDTEDLTDRPVAGRDVANDVYKEYDKLVGVDSRRLSQEARDAIEQAKQTRIGPADRGDVDVAEEVIRPETPTESAPEPDLSDLQIMDPEGIEDMPPLPKDATEDGGLMSRDTSSEEGETTTDAGLMSKPLTDDDMGLPEDRSTTEKDMAFNTAFVTKMAKSEGKVDHVDSLGIPTLGYGILPATARKYGFDPDSAEYSDRKVLAEAVYDAMYKEAKTSYSDVFANLNESQKIGVLSLYINLGELPDGVVTALSSATPDFDAARDSLSTVVLGSPRDGAGNRKKDSNKNTIYTSNKGLSKRRAGEYNILMEDQSGFIPVKTVSVEGTKQTPVFVWKDKDGKEIRRYTPTVTGQGKVYQGLDDSSTMTDVSV